MPENLQTERWLPVPGYLGLYEVSELGRVRSLDRLCLGKDGREEVHRGQILAPQKLKNGYLEVYLCRGAKREHRTVHSLVADAFLGPRPKGHDILHFDGNRENNSYTNLGYDTRAENLHSTYLYGGKQANGKLSLTDVDAIRSRLTAGESGYSIAKDYGVHPSAIYHIRDGKSFAWYKGGDNDATQ